jgi:hypothetical protein
MAFDLFEIGFLTAIGAWFFMYIFDKLLKYAIDKVFFTWIWNYIKRWVRILMTRANPIETEFVFSIVFNEEKINDSVDKFKQIIQSISEEYRDRLNFSDITWKENNIFSLFSIRYNDKSYIINIRRKISYNNDMINVYKYNMETINFLVNGLTFSIKSYFPFYYIDKNILALNSINNIFKEEFKKYYTIQNYSKGNFIISPIKLKFNVDDWIKDKTFEASLFLKSKEDIIINLYPKKAEIIFPDILMDNKVSEYLQEVVLNYYL